MELHGYICSARWRHIVPLANVMPGLALPKPRLASFQSAWLSFSMPARKVTSLKSLKLIVSNGRCQKTVENMSCCWSEMTNTLVSSFKSTLLCCIIKCIHCILYTTLVVLQNSHPGHTFQALDSKRRREVLREFLEAVVLSLPTTVFLFGIIHGIQAARLAALSKAKCEVKNQFQKTGKGKGGKGKKNTQKKEKRCSGLTPHTCRCALRPPPTAPASRHNPILLRPWRLVPGPKGKWAVCSSETSSLINMMKTVSSKSWMVTEAWINGRQPCWRQWQTCWKGGSTQEYFLKNSKTWWVSTNQKNS